MGACACGQPSPGFNPKKAPEEEELSSSSPSAGHRWPWGRVTASWALCHNPLSSHRGVTPHCESQALAEAVASGFLSTETAISGA